MIVDNGAAALVQVAVDAPLRAAFSYLPPPGTAAHSIPLGARVRVPLGRSEAVGVVVSYADAGGVPQAALKSVHEVLDTAGLLDARLMQLLRWTADYYHHPVGEVIASALPKPLRNGAPLIAPQRGWSLTAAGAEALAQGLARRAPRQQGLLERIAAEPTGLAVSALGADADPWLAAARALQRRGWIIAIELESAALIDQPAAAEVAGARTPFALELSGAQSEAIAAIDGASGHYAAFVLRGATGSGKTEVYLRCAQRTLARGASVLVLVPEIGLTPQLVSRFRERLTSPVVVLHSGLSDGERFNAWREAWSGHARVVLGTRSAVFTPLPALGLIVVDEEHDSSYKQQEGGCRYSARDLAVMRAQQYGVPVVLGSATPAFESLHNLERGRYRGLALPRRSDQAEPPRLALIDLRAHTVQQGLSTPAIEAIRRHLAAGSQALVYINRRGYAPTLLCTACGWIAPCRDCDARLTVHRRGAQLRCHHCGAVESLPERCPRCGHVVKSVGQGTERIEDLLQTLFPKHPLARLDRDTAGAPVELEAIVQRVLSGEARILVGTQMVTKGHHFPGLSLVVVLNADQGLFSTDFRAAERLAQTIVQVAGRAGRERSRGEVLIQTEYPDHPLLQSLLTGGYDGFAATALAERAAARWPPFGRLALVRASTRSSDGALAFLTAARAAAPSVREVRLLGPVPAALARRAGRHYAQLLLESAERGALHRFIDTWLPELERLARVHRVRYALDVDPLDIQ